MTMTIRPAAAPDVVPLAELIKEVEEHYGATQIADLATRIKQTEEALFGSPPLAAALVAVDESGLLTGLAAYTWLWPAAGATHSLYLKELFVRERFRRLGVGRLLMAELLAIAQRRSGCIRMEWTTDHDSAGARQFYADLGFTELPRKIFYRAPVTEA